MAREVVDPSATYEPALAAALANYPDALVAAIDESGLFVPLPPSVELHGQRTAVARSALDLVHSSSRATVIDAWERAKRDGAAHVTVDLGGEGGGRAALQFYDVRARHDVFIGLLIGVDGAAEDLAHAADIAAPPPRVARVQKTELAVIAGADPDLTAMLGWDHGDFVGRRSLDFVHPDDQDRAIDAWMDVLANPDGLRRVRLRHLHRDGRWIWVEIENRNLLDKRGVVECEMFDISDEMQAVEALAASERLIRRLADALPVAIMQFDAELKIVYANDRLNDVLGAHAGATQEELLRAVADPDALKPAIRAVLDGRDIDFDLAIDRLDGSGRRLCTLALRALVGPDGEVSGAVACLSDVTDAARLRAELEQRATFDALTGCINRASVIGALEDALARDTARTTAAIFIDLDDFKAVNDEYGHAVGDMVLVAIAARLRDHVRAGDIVGRLGGDEFLVVATGASPDGALELGARISEAVAAPLDLDGRTIHPRASIGVAHARRTGPAVTSETLIAEADGAMYAAKAAGDGVPCLASGSREPVIHLREGMADTGNRLRTAISEGQLEVHYQPILTLDERSPIGYEALLRWRRDGRLVPAAEFIAAAETTGLICEIGPWVVDEVCRQAVAARQPDLRWFINVSPRELAAPRTIAAFGDALDRHGASPSSIVIEITEHAALVDGGVASSVVPQLAQLGIGVALDDFGTGSSALSALLDVHAHWVKIDRRFVAAVSEERGRSLVEGTIALATAVGARPIAEGIETDEELAVLRELGVAHGQGFLLGRPAPFTQWCEDGEEHDANCR